MWKWMTFVVGNSGSSRALVKASALAALGVCVGLGAGCGSSGHTSVVYEERYERVHEPPPAVVIEEVRYERVAPPRVVRERVYVAPRHEEHFRGRPVVVREVERDRREHHRPSEGRRSTTVRAEVDVR